MILPSWFRSSLQIFRFTLFGGSVLLPKPTKARSALCHWSSSMVRGRKRLILVSSGVTPPPIISAMDPVTTTDGFLGSSVCVLYAGHPQCRVDRVPLRQDPSQQWVVRVVAGHRCSEAPRSQEDFHTHGTINNDLQALHRSKDINRAPVSSGAIVIKY